MIDIGLGGLSFRYIDTDIDPSPSDDLLILLNKPRFYLDHLPYQLVTDNHLPNEFIFSAVTVRRMGVEFGDLTATQRTQLEDFILFCSIVNSSFKRQFDATGESLEMIRSL